MSYASVLDTAGSWTWELADQITQSSPASGVIHTRAIARDLVPRRFTLAWNPGRFATWRLIKQHYDANAHSTFQVTEPKTGATIDVTYAAAPQMRRVSAQVASIQVQLEEALAKD